MKTLKATDEFQQRPMRAEAKPILVEMLEAAIDIGYYSGSVGATKIVDDQESDFILEVSYRITRRSK